MRTAVWMGAVAILVVAGCGGTGGRAATGSARDVLTIEELRGQELASVYDLVAKLRSEWLRPRGQGSMALASNEFPLVYLDNTRYGELETLRSLRVDDVREIRWLSGPEATHRYGTGHAGGVILVLTRR